MKFQNIFKITFFILFRLKSYIFKTHTNKAGFENIQKYSNIN